MAIPSLAGIMPATPAVPGIRFESGNPFLEGYAQTDRLMNQQAEEARARQRAEQLLWQFEQLREKAMTARAIDDAAREAFGAAGMPMPTGMPSPTPPAAGGAVPVPEPGPIAGPRDTSYTTAPVADRTIDPSFDPVRFLATNRRRESGSEQGQIDARNPRSSAAGPDQFINSTWLAVLPTAAQRIGLDLSGMTREQMLALRTDPRIGDELGKVATLVLADQNRTQMERALGHKVGEGHLGLAHGFGAQGAVGVLQADPATVADQHFPPKVIDANPHLRGKTLADIMRQYGITVPNAPGAVPSMMGRVPTPEQQAASDRMAATPAGQAAQNFDWRQHTTAQPASATGSGIDALFQRYTNPAMQDYRQRLAGIPGAGAELMKSYTSEFGDRDKFGIQAFELAAKGQPDMARMVAQAAGLNIDPRLFANRDLSTKAFDVLKTLAGQDPGYVAKVMQQVLRGVPMGQAMEAAGSPKSWREQYYGAGRAGGTSAAPYQFINRADGALVRVNKATGQHEVVIEPGRPDQARARAANVAAAMVKGGSITPQQMPLVMSIMERALMGDQEALRQMEDMLGPQAAPPDQRSLWESRPQWMGGQPAPTPPPPPRLNQPAAPMATPPAAGPQGNDPLGLR